MRQGVKLFTGLNDIFPTVWAEMQRGSLWFSWVLLSRIVTREKIFSVQARGTPKLGDRSSEKEVMETVLVPGRWRSEREDCNMTFFPSFSWASPASSASQQSVCQSLRLAPFTTTLRTCWSCNEETRTKLLSSYKPVVCFPKQPDGGLCFKSEFRAGRASGNILNIQLVTFLSSLPQWVSPEINPVWNTFCGLGYRDTRTLSNMANVKNLAHFKGHTQLKKPSLDPRILVTKKK